MPDTIDATPVPAAAADQERQQAEAIIGGPTWYSDAADYWGAVEPTVQGMLGGFGTLTDIDCKASIQFVNEFVTPSPSQPQPPSSTTTTTSSTRPSRPRIGTSLACDCGAGIGRVSKHFLLSVFDKVDLVEQTPKFLDQAKLAFQGDQRVKDRVDRFIPLGLQDFVPEEGRYDLIWTQWVIGHLTDDHLVQFFQRCRKGLKKEGGLIGVKENVTRADVELDREDSSVTRPPGLLRELFKKAGLRIVKEEIQKGFPSQLYPVHM
ncbi:hypothetical protein HKX48_002790 [Thoreauomyces humboldtii]|nr:hypothetical protein HKX48_002790 [Thoreauomyces humboldtii]